MSGIYREKKNLLGMNCAYKPWRRDSWRISFNKTSSVVPKSEKEDKDEDEQQEGN